MNRATLTRKEAIELVKHLRRLREDIQNTFADVAKHQLTYLEAIKKEYEPDGRIGKLTFSKMNQWHLKNGTNEAKKEIQEKIHAMEEEVNQEYAQKTQMYREDITKFLTLPSQWIPFPLVDCWHSEDDSSEYGFVDQSRVALRFLEEFLVKMYNLQEGELT